MCQLPACESDQGMMGVTRDPAQDEDTVVTACLSGEAGREYSISSQGWDLDKLCPQWIIKFKSVNKQHPGEILHIPKIWRKKI